MRRREFITVVGGAVVALPLTASGQQASQPPLVVWFASATLSAASRWMNFLREGLKELGHIEGRDFEFVARFAEYQVERLPVVAKEVVSLKPTIIVAGAVDTAVEARKVTSTIPIVSAALADAEHLGLVASYAHPGGNVTGITPYVDGLPAKQMEVARELVPGARVVGLLGNLNDPKAPPQRDELEAVAHSQGIKVVVPEIRGPDDLAHAVEALKSERAEVVIVLQTTMLLGQRQRIAELLAATRVPAVYGYREHVDEGGLISYGVDLSWCWHHLADYVDKILHGAQPSDLPVEFPTKLQMVINLRTAKTLALTIPPSLLARADEVIE